ncbi:hypothetical protein IVA88_08490 [Bradyrhizobium sp. 149]|uniref:hypothetical protein n=1 Tax=Bradyrhizobium sp. 149 TaxID=2782624 RepID=UPI001FF9BA34|nr:hypothetical protein [Bradyrhizobium sp. 149]MCK1651478.1 hypothetical protein [Bradyrhizobium sp. 149]
MWPGNDNVPDARQNETLTFLIKSQRRVIAHCEKLLAADGLPADDRKRLLRLRNAAEAALAGLTLTEAA